MGFLTQKAKEDLDAVKVICSNLHSIIIFKNRYSHASEDSFINKKSENDNFSIPKNAIKASYKSKFFSYCKNLISLISKKVKILFDQ